VSIVRACSYHAEQYASGMRHFEIRKDLPASVLSALLFALGKRPPGEGTATQYVSNSPRLGCSLGEQGHVSETSRERETKSAKGRGIREEISLDAL
jgi:hypothetical protein